MTARLSEADICRIHITPAIQAAGWDLKRQVREQVTFTDGRNTDHWNLIHSFYQNYEIQSGFFKHLLVVIDKLQIKSLIRIKANLYPKTDKIIEHDFHADFDFSHKSGLYSLNTNNGFTIMEDGERIESVANRMLSFPANIKHCGTSCTDERRRIVINFNYFK